MKIPYLLIVTVVLLTGCKSEKKDAFELEIITKELNSADVKRDKYFDYVTSDEPAVEESQSIIQYKLTNNTDKTYYFNVDNFRRLNYELISIKHGYLKIYSENNIYQEPKLSIPSMGLTNKDREMEYLKYNTYYNMTDRNFTIHAGETLYFEWYLILPFGTLDHGIVYSVDLEPNKKYEAEILVNSDSVGYKNSISRSDIKTIKQNGYEVFHGTIKSKNKIPLRFNKVKNPPLKINTYTAG